MNIHYLSVPGILISAVLSLVLTVSTPRITKFVGKLTNRDYWDAKVEAKLEEYKKTKNIKDGRKYNSLRIRLMCIGLLTFIFTLLFLYGPLFMLYFHIIDTPHGFLWWFLYFFWLGVGLRFIISKTFPQIL